MKNIFLIFMGIFVGCLGQDTDSCKKNMTKPAPSKIDNIPIYEKDKKEVSECYIANVEYYRLNKDKIDNGNLFDPFSNYYANDSLGYQKLSTHTNENIEVKVDEIYYSPDKLRAIIFIGIKQKRNKDRAFNAICLIGLRNDASQRLMLYPFRLFSQTGYLNYEDPLHAIKSSYFNCIAKSKDIWGHEYRTNLGDKDFWRNNLLFDKVVTSDSFKYHESIFPPNEKLYNFQTYSVSDMDGKHSDNHYKYDIVNCNSF